MPAHRSPIDLSNSRSGGKFEARFRVWGNHKEATDGPMIQTDPDMPPSRILWQSDRHGITVRLNDKQPALSPGGAIILSAEGPTEGYRRVADMEPTRIAKMGIVTAMVMNHSDVVLRDPAVLGALDVLDSAYDYTGNITAGAAVWSPHTNTAPVYTNIAQLSWKYATNTEPPEFSRRLDAQGMSIIQDALVVPEATAAGIEAALDQIGGPEYVVGQARDNYVEYLAGVAAAATVEAAQ
jgi:hypothetical protein